MTLIDDHGFDALRERGQRLSQRHDRLREQAESRRDAHQQATDALNTAEESLDAARATLDDGSPRQALEHLDGVPATLNDARDPIDEYGFADLRERLDTLNDRHDRLRAEAKDALTNVPTSIPSAPRLSLSYDDIRKGDPLGRGGNADVFHATVTTDDGGLDFALREPWMSGTLHTEIVERMMAEAETWQKLDDHDHIVGVVDYGSTPLPWIAMEYIDAGHLGERTDDMALRQKLLTAIAVTKAVRNAHRRGVAHLDLKPENVLLRSVGNAWDVPKVADWGLSKHLLDHSKSMEGLSPHYAAPEQFDDQYGSADDITDVYQLGAVLYELFTGQPPFEGQTFKVINKIQTETPTPPSELVDVPPELDDILLTALTTEKTDRYETVVNFRNDLQSLFEAV